MKVKKKGLNLFGMLAMGMIILVGMSGISYAEDTTSVFNKAYIPGYGTNRIDILNLTDHTIEIGKITVENGPVSAAFAPAGDMILVSNYTANSVSVIDPSTDTVTRTLSTGFSAPMGIAFNSNGSKAYVTSNSTNTLTVIDTQTWEQSSITLAGVSCSASTIGNDVYVTSLNSYNLYKIDTVSDTVSDTMNLNTGSQGIAANLEGTKLYVACTNGQLKVIDPTNFSVESAHDIGSTLSGVDISSDGSEIYVVDRGESKFYAIDATDYSVLGSAVVGSSCYGLGIQGDYAYVLSMANSAVYVIDLNTYTLTRTISTSTSPVSFGTFMVSTKVYNEVTKSSDATLSTLSISTGTLSPAFSADTTAYTASVANSVTSLKVTPTVSDSNATVKVQGTSVTSGSESGSINLAVGGNTINVVVTAEDASTKTYTIVVTRLPQAESDTTAPTLTAGTVSRSSDTEGTVKFTSNEAGSYYYYTIVADGASAPTIDTSGAGTACTTDEITITNPTGLTAGAKDIYIKVKDAAGNVSDALKIDITVYTSSGGSSGGSSKHSSSTNTTTKSQQSVTVIVNGKEQDAGKETNTTEDGKTTVTVKVDSKAIESKINEVIKNDVDVTDNIIQVPVSDTKSEVAKVELTGDIVKKLEENSFDVSVKRDNVEYVIPAEEFTISNVAQNLGVAETDLADIKVEVRITKLDEKVVEKYNEVAKANGAELVFTPVEFEIVANTTNIDGKEQEQPINKFSNYVERIMGIPAGVDPSKITTGIVFNADGTYSHVPTRVYQKDGTWYAKLDSLTNSEYSIIWNPVTVKSVENHWAKDTVNDMASRLIIFNAETFEPNKAITRADFAEYIVRGLGLYREGSNYENRFADVSSENERTMAILIASKYGIVSGYSDGTFKGDKQITREEAMVMYQRAMKITKLTGKDTNRITTYTDSTQVSKWAVPYVTEVLAAHVFNGTSDTNISPKSKLTYAEAAQAVKNLLVESELIDK
jgi:YVTN family beta-propeller protein